jgi:hypothetical protein
MDHVLLACHTTWQELAHVEVIGMCEHGDHPFSVDMFNKFLLSIHLNFLFNAHLQTQLID